MKEDTVIVPKIAAVERREARVPGNNGTRHLLKGANLLPKRRPALRSLTHVREKKRKGACPAPALKGPMAHAYIPGDAPPRCL